MKFKPTIFAGLFAVMFITPVCAAASKIAKVPMGTQSQINEIINALKEVLPESQTVQAMTGTTSQKAGFERAGGYYAATHGYCLSAFKGLLAKALKDKNWATNTQYAKDYVPVLQNSSEFYALPYCDITRVRDFPPGVIFVFEGGAIQPAGHIMITLPNGKEFPITTGRTNCDGGWVRNSKGQIVCGENGWRYGSSCWAFVPTDVALDQISSSSGGVCGFDDPQITLPDKGFKGIKTDTTSVKVTASASTQAVKATVSASATASTITQCCRESVLTDKNIAATDPCVAPLKKFLAANPSATQTSKTLLPNTNYLQSVQYASPTAKLSMTFVCKPPPETPKTKPDDTAPKTPVLKKTDPKKIKKNDPYAADATIEMCCTESDLKPGGKCESGLSQIIKALEDPYLELSYVEFYRPGGFVRFLQLVDGEYFQRIELVCDQEPGAGKSDIITPPSAPAQQTTVFDPIKIDGCFQNTDADITSMFLKTKTVTDTWDQLAGLQRNLTADTCGDRFTNFDCINKYLTIELVGDYITQVVFESVSSDNSKVSTQTITVNCDRVGEISASEKQTTVDTGATGSDQQLAADIKAKKDEIISVKQQINDIAGGYDTDKKSVWTTADGGFNYGRAAVDATAAAILGTVGGIVVHNIVKNKNIQSGWDAIGCSVNGTRVADFGDTFQISGAADQDTCTANGMRGNAFVWAATNSAGTDYAMMRADPAGANSCWARVDVTSTDPKINLSDVPSRYFVMGSNIQCGSWANHDAIQKKILDSKKTSRTWATVGGAVGGAAIGFGAMELFGNRLIGGGIEGQKDRGLTKDQLLRSKMIAADHDGGAAKFDQYRALQIKLTQLCSALRSLDPLTIMEECK